MFFTSIMPTYRLAGTRDQLLFQIGQLNLQISSLEGQQRAKRLENATDTVLVLKMRYERLLRNVMTLARTVRESRLLCQSGVGNCSALARYQEIYQQAANDFIQGYIVYRSSQVSEDVVRQIAELKLAVAQAEARLAATNAVSVLSTSVTQSVQQFSNFEWVPSGKSLEKQDAHMNLTNGIHKRPFLFIQTPPEDGCSDCFSTFHEVIPEKVTARLYFLGMERNWFDPGFFLKSYMKKVSSPTLHIMWLMLLFCTSANKYSSISCGLCPVQTWLPRG